jgi:hypothetical protein
MATATKYAKAAPPPRNARKDSPRAPSLLDRLAQMTDRLYHFLASLKLAVITLGTLAATLAYATFFESWYGTAASQEVVYKSPGFAVLLAFLATNILCAALIRYPWKRRQTGFVVTHAGLLILLAGSYYSVRTADEGQVGMLEGDVKSELVRIDYPVIRIWEVDPHTRQRSREFDLPFRPGPFEWGADKPRRAGLLGRAVSLLTFGLLGSDAAQGKVLSDSRDPFQFVVKQHLPAAVPAVAHVAAPEGAPMVRLTLQVKPPGMPHPHDAFETEEDHWFATDPMKKFYRVVRSNPPVQIVFASVDRPELVDDFLKPPAAAGSAGVARFRYPDRAGKNRTFDWVLAGQTGKSVSLPDSDLLVTLTAIEEFPTGTGSLDRYLGGDPIPISVFKIARGQDAPVTHMALANLPMVPNLIPSADQPETESRQPLASIHYVIAPTVDPKVNGRFGQIEILAGPENALYYRVFGRGKESTGELRAAGPLKMRESVAAFGGAANMPMTVAFRLDEYLPAAIEKQIYRPIVLPKGQMGNGIAAFQADMTVDGQSQEVWLSRSENLDPPPSRFIPFRNALYEVMYDVDRKPLGFDLKLDDFDTGFEPGTEQATHFESKVRLTDPEMGIKDKPYRIYMNNPLDHRGYTFYQSNYIRVRDPHTRQFTGQFQSVFQVAKNPGRPIIYAGCILVVVGTFLQFYMRAGIFTDGGKRERERAARKLQGKSAAKSTEARPEQSAAQDSIDDL